MNQRLAEIMKGRFAKLKKGKFLFHLDGGPLSYRQIQQHYNEALKKAGLYGKFSGTHIMRHTMAQMANLTSTSGLNAVKAITGHLDDSMAQHYGGLPALESTKRVIQNVEQYLAK